MVKKILEERMITLAEVKEVLENNIKKYGEDSLDSFQENTLEHAKRFAKTDVKTALKLKDMLMEDYKLNELYAIMIANIIPNTVEELRAILEKKLKKFKLKDDDLQEMIYKMQDIVKESQ